MDKTNKPFELKGGDIVIIKGEKVLVFDTTQAGLDSTTIRFTKVDSQNVEYITLFDDVNITRLN